MVCLIAPNDFKGHASTHEFVREEGVLMTACQVSAYRMPLNRSRPPGDSYDISVCFSGSCSGERYEALWGTKSWPLGVVVCVYMVGE